jgi:quercetin dioxygenase-like cupin family protein
VAHNARMADKTVPEAELKKTDAGLIPQGEGWFVVNARDVSWIRGEERGQDTDFEGGQEWAELGFRIQIVAPGQRGVYHGERGQEDFLVVSGECVLVIEGQERRLKAWDFVHCPPWTKHAFVGAGDGPCVIVMVGSRAGGFEVMYAVDEVAAQHDASVLEETSSPDEAYARWGPGGADGVSRGVAPVVNCWFTLGRSGEERPQVEGGPGIRGRNRLGPPSLSEGTGAGRVVV